MSFAKSRKINIYFLYKKLFGRGKHQWNWSLIKAWDILTFLVRQKISHMKKFQFVFYFFRENTYKMAANFHWIFLPSLSDFFLLKVKAIATKIHLYGVCSILSFKIFAIVKCIFKVNGKNRRTRLSIG